jgi:hypothetical protein
MLQHRMYFNPKAICTVIKAIVIEKTTSIQKEVVNFSKRRT